MEASLMLRLGWFSTARGQTSPQLLKAVHDAIQRQELEARIEVVFCNREFGEFESSDRFQELVRSYGYPLVTFSYQDYRRQRGLPVVRAGELIPSWRSDYDQELIDLLEPYPFDLGVLAGYMLVASKKMCQRYDLLNLHPGAPGGPVGSWQQVIWQLIAEKASQSGVMMHLVTPELDSGPVVSCCRYPIVGSNLDDLWQKLGDQSVKEVCALDGESNHLFTEIRQLGVAREVPLLTATLSACASGRIQVIDGRVLDSRGESIDAFDLTEKIERLISGG